MWCLKVDFRPIRIDLGSLGVSVASLRIKFGSLGVDFGPFPGDFGPLTIKIWDFRVGFGLLKSILAATFYFWESIKYL